MRNRRIWKKIRERRSSAWRPGDLGTISAETGDQLSGRSSKGLTEIWGAWVGMGGVRFLGTQVDGGSAEVSDDIYT